jgi:hypothetical protein
MGLDMWLPSVFNFDDAQQVERILDGVADNMKRKIAMRCNTHPHEYVRMVYDAYRATGGYYREAYNGRGLLTLMGMSWRKVIDSLEDKTTLPPTHARHLLAELEARPFTRAMLFEEERRPDDTEVRISRQMEKLVGIQPTAPIEADLSDREIDEALHLYAKRRQELMALLRIAIERNEPLRVSS